MLRLALLFFFLFLDYVRVEGWTSKTHWRGLRSARSGVLLRGRLLLLGLLLEQLLQTSVILQGQRFRDA